MNETRYIDYQDGQYLIRGDKTGKVYSTHFSQEEAEDELYLGEFDFEIVGTSEKGDL